MAENAGGDKLVYFLIGAGIGAVTALLFAPKAGAELRAELADATRRGIDVAKETGREVGDRAAEYYQTSAEKAADIATRGRDTVADIATRSREAVDDITVRGKEVLDREKSKIAAAFEAGKQGYREAKQADKASAAFEES
jgi:gas vesicle protein